MQSYTSLTRTFGPVFDKDSKILILGSFPSVRSREVNFFYGHPQNRFWPLLGKVFNADIPADTEGRRDFAIKNKIALWDVIDSCEIIGSSDSSIKNVVPVDIDIVLSAAEINGIFCNGTAAHSLYCKHLLPICGRSAVKLPSTSPANAAWSAERLYEQWKVIRNCIYD